MNKKIILASKSPRRKKLLEQVNIQFETISVDTPEEMLPNEDPASCVLRIAKEKCFAAKNICETGIILTADTIVVLDGKKLGKPEGKVEAKTMLKSLSSKTHSVYTGFCLYDIEANNFVTNYVETKVTFCKLSDEEIEEYITTGSPLDKAGAYGIQDDFGAVFINRIEGCYYNVVGLPLSKVYHEIKKMME